MVSPDDVAMTLAVIGAMKKISKTRILDYVRSHPRAHVRDFSKEFLGGMLLKSTGGTQRAYYAVDWRLRRARRLLGYPPIQGHQSSADRRNQGP